MIVAENVFVPEELILKPSDTPPPEVLLEMEGLEARDRWPMEPLFPLGVLAPMLGAAMAMLEHVVEVMDRRPVVGWTFTTQTASEALIGMTGRAAMEIDSAWLRPSSCRDAGRGGTATGLDWIRQGADPGGLWLCHGTTAWGRRAADGRGRTWCLRVVQSLAALLARPQRGHAPQRAQ